MSKLGTHTGTQPTGLGEFLSGTSIAESPVPMLFALDNNIASTIASNSPTTKLIFRTQQFGPDNGNMYVGDPIAAGRARFDQCWPVLQQNPAQFYALDNEPGRADVEGLTWLCGYYLGEMQRADEVGAKLCVGEWSTGMPPISVTESKRIIDLLDVELPKLNMGSINEVCLDKIELLAEQHKAVIDEDSMRLTLNGDVYTEVDYIGIYTPMLRYAMTHGHILGLHEYSLEGPMIGSPLCLRYRTLYNALPADARPLFAITEAGPGAGYGTAYSGQAYVSVVAAYDAEVMRDRYVIVAELFKLGKGESNMAEVMPLLTQYVIDHPTPDEPPPADEFIFQHYANAITGAIISTDPNYDLTLLSDMAIKAQYIPKPPPPVQLHEFTLTVDPPSEAHRVTQTPSGTMFPHGQVIQLRAV